MPAGIKRQGSTTYQPPKVVNVVTPNGSYVANNRYNKDDEYVPPTPPPPSPPIAQASQGILGSSAVQGAAVNSSPANPLLNTLAQLGQAVSQRVINPITSLPIYGTTMQPLTSFNFGAQNQSTAPTASTNFGGLQPTPNYQSNLLSKNLNERPVPQTYQPPAERPPTAFNGGGVSPTDQAYGYNNEYLSNFISPTGQPYTVIAGYDNKGKPLEVPAVLPINLFDSYSPASRALLWQAKKDMGYVLFGGQYIYVGPGGYQREGQMFNGSNYGGSSDSGGYSSSGGGGGGGGKGRGGGGGGGGTATPKNTQSGMVGVQPTPATLNQKPGIGGSSAVNFNTSTG